MQVSSERGQVAYPTFGLYHATKWGIEGFIEAVAQEVAPFGIDCVLVEPGPTATNFGEGLDQAEATEVYDATPSGDMRRGVVTGSFAIKGDARLTVDAMIEAGDSEHPPLRLALGSTAYESIEAALIRRLEAIRAQKGIAFAADKPA